MRRLILLLGVFLVLLGAWIVLRNGAWAAPEAEPLWMPQPGLASTPSLDPLDSRQICEHAVNLKARFSPASVRTAILGYVVEPEGVIDDITVAGTSGSKALDEAIIACVATLRFLPGNKGRAMIVQWK
ncbi:MAG TPA: hypothetical protein VMD53_05195 [Rhizomicrobium sp.]|nr:hypothetical protein [Rhizomicrobium sp.]